LIGLRALLIVAGAAALTGAAAAPAQTAAAAPPAGAAATAAPPAVANPAPPDPCSSLDLTAVRVTRVRRVPPLEVQAGPAAATAAPGRKNLPLVKLRDTIAVTVEGLSLLLAREKCLEKDSGERSLILYLDRRPLPDVIAQPPTDPSRSELMFPLKRTEASRDVWTYLLGRPRWDDREVEVSVGIDNQYAVPSTASVDLRVIPRGWFAFWLLIFATFAVGFVLLALRSNVLRDPVKSPYGARPPYSLARTQAAWWFFLILASYLLIGMVTGDFSTSITGTVLVLAGISAGTAAGSAFIDSSKSSRTSQDMDSARATVLWSEVEALRKEIGTLQTAVQATGAPAQAQAMADMEELRLEKLSLYRKLTNQSESFLLDILSDNGGVNFHRFQALAWTVVLGIVFVGQVYRDLAMPQFNETLLGLMGISSGTYLGMKIPEGAAPNPVPTNPPAPDQ
jgi:hypothetical protein